jgi:hypothetical protein
MALSAIVERPLIGVEAQRILLLQRSALVPPGSTALGIGWHALMLADGVRNSRVRIPHPPPCSGRAKLRDFREVRRTLDVGPIRS